MFIIGLIAYIFGKVLMVPIVIKILDYLAYDCGIQFFWKPMGFAHAHHDIVACIFCLPCVYFLVKLYPNAHEID